ncbi:hypothetical protein C8Q70DRAFT_96735 [Cubamyces menziesii]|nr:hypothetical protein C8Q70DRAFT_96735 [Cubamyces menziesii]
MRVRAMWACAPVCPGVVETMWMEAGRPGPGRVDRDIGTEVRSFEIVQDARGRNARMFLLFCAKRHRHPSNRDGRDSGLWRRCKRRPHVSEHPCYGMVDGTKRSGTGRVCKWGSLTVVDELFMTPALMVYGAASTMVDSGFSTLDVGRPCRATRESVETSQCGCCGPMRASTRCGTVGSSFLEKEDGP